MIGNQKKKRRERNRHVNKTWGEVGEGRKDCEASTDTVCLDSEVSAYSESWYDSDISCTKDLKFKSAPKMTEIEVNGKKICAVLENLNPAQSWQLACEDPYVRIIRPIPRTAVNEMMKEVLMELKRKHLEPVWKPIEDLEFYLPGSKEEPDLIVEEYSRRKLFAYYALKMDKDDNEHHKLREYWDRGNGKDAPLVKSEHCVLCNKCRCLLYERDFSSILFGKK